MAEQTKDMCVVEFQPQGKRVRVAKGDTVFQAAQKAGLPLASDCGGKGRCGRCRVKVVSGDLSAPDHAEQAVLERGQFPAQFRLACRARLLGDAKIQVDAGSMQTGQVLLLHGTDRTPQSIDPIECRTVGFDPPTLQDQRSDLRRVLDELDLAEDARQGLHPQMVARLTGLIRASQDGLTAFVRHGALIGAGPPDSAPYGLAVDIGTTSLAAGLFELTTGREIASAGLMNPQISLGEDVISRMSHAVRKPGGARELASLVRDALDSLTEELCAAAGISPWLITDAVMCANTAMSHLLLELPVAYLARAPYVAGFSSHLSLMATDLGLKAAPLARVSIMPCIQGFVGGDHVAMILACEIDRARDTVIGIDIGTNTEIVLAKPGPEGGLHVASCASGPALEGAHIRDGMRAGPGAIERVRIGPQGPEVMTVGAQMPAGICGSGIVDSIAVLIRAGLVDQWGRLQKTAEGVKELGGQAAYQLIPGSKSATGEDILITQGDISEVQLAKAAIYAGVQTVLQKTGTPPEEVSAVYLAGAFGSHLNLDSALTMGLLPRLPKASYIQAGNAASVGAYLNLLSSAEAGRALRIARSARLIELAGDPDFTHLYARGLRFTRPQGA